MASKSRRRRRKSGGSQSPNGASVATVTLAPGSVPTDEQLEQEAAELESELKERYDGIVCSAKTGEGLETLMHTLEHRLFQTRHAARSQP